MERLLKAIESAKSVGALTGAGVSTLCGIPDFRGPKGLYRQPDAERIFDIDWFDRDPSVYYRGCADLVYGLAKFEPGPVHRALAALERAGRLSGIATQNIDMLLAESAGRIVQILPSAMSHEYNVGSMWLDAIRDHRAAIIARGNSEVEFSRAACLEVNEAANMMATQALPSGHSPALSGKAIYWLPEGPKVMS